METTGLSPELTLLVQGPICRTGSNLRRQKSAALGRDNKEYLRIYEDLRNLFGCYIKGYRAHLFSVQGEHWQVKLNTMAVAAEKDRKGGFPGSDRNLYGQDKTVTPDPGIAWGVAGRGTLSCKVNNSQQAHDPALVYVVVWKGLCLLGLVSWRKIVFGRQACG